MTTISNKPISFIHLNLIFLFVFIFPGFIQAEEFQKVQLTEKPVLARERIDWSLYSKLDKLSPNERKQIFIHGLRMTPLNPAHWAFRRFDKTLTRDLVPIRPYYLKQSAENTNYKLREISLDVKFRDVEEALMLTNPQASLPLLKIGLAGKLKVGVSGHYHKQDEEYFVRLTPHPTIKSGLFYRKHEKVISLEEFEQNIVQTKDAHRLRITVDDNGIKVSLDSKNHLSYQAKNLSQGLVSLTSDWEPIELTTLEVKGIDVSSGDEIITTGLVKLPKLK